jgi:anti-anti-sigma factor
MENSSPPHLSSPLPVGADIVKLLRELSAASGGGNNDNKYSLSVEYREGGLLVLRVSGFLLQPIPLEFTTRFESLLVHSAVSSVLVDLGRCTYLSSTIMSYLVKYFDLSTGAGKRIAMVRPNEKVVKVLQAIGLDEFFSFHPSEAEALTALRGGS